jgi:toxin ParE1/3/4
MSLRILQRRRARQDILEIIAYIGERNPQAAGRVFAAYERALTSLARSPAIGRRYPSDNPRLEGLRAFPIGRFRSYLIFYRHTADALDVVRVLHGRRDLASLLRREEPD